MTGQPCRMHNVDVGEGGRGHPLAAAGGESGRAGATSPPGHTTSITHHNIERLRSPTTRCITTVPRSRATPARVHPAVGRLSPGRITSITKASNFQHDLPQGMACIRPVLLASPAVHEVRAPTLLLGQFADGIASIADCSRENRTPCTTSWTLLITVHSHSCAALRRIE